MKTKYKVMVTVAGVVAVAAAFFVQGFATRMALTVLGTFLMTPLWALIVNAETGPKSKASDPLNEYSVEVFESLEEDSRRMREFMDDSHRAS